jgi:hypothetical protein
VPAIDNMLSHPAEAADVLGRIAADADFVAGTVAVGKGLPVAWVRVKE